MNADLAPKHGLLAGIVRFKNGQLNGYLARPDDDCPHPGVILVQEWWGVNDQIKEMTDRLAREGFVVLAPDLYHGAVATEPDQAQKAMMALNKDAAVQDIREAIDYLQGRDDVEPKQLGMTGFCMGGFLTWKAAEVSDGHLKAIAPFYGGYYEPEAQDIRKIQAPVLAVWGTEDESIPPEARDHIIRLLEQEGKTLKPLVLEAPHAFMNDQRPSFRKHEAATAWQELVAWFKHYLK